MKPEELNVTNYHSSEANKSFMSNSQFGDFMRCPARTVAKINGQWDTGNQLALVFGSYVDCAVLTPLDLPEWYAANMAAMVEVGLLSKAAKTYGGKLKAINHADAMIEAAKKDKLFMQMLEGEHQNIYTAEVFGVQWRVMLDSINVAEKRIVDLKTTKDCDKKSWYNRDSIFDQINGTSSFHNFKGDYISEWAYHRQGAIYEKVVGAELGIDTSDWEVYIAAISKHTPKEVNPLLQECMSVPLDIARLTADRPAMELELQTIQDYLPQIIRWKSGEDVPVGCGKCAFCLANMPTVIRDSKSATFEV